MSNVIVSEEMGAAYFQAAFGIANNHGGPFGAVIVEKIDDGSYQIIGMGHNEVIKNQDPTCHAEIQAIRQACKHKGTYDLSGCEIYTTCYPCEMCLGAIKWARIDKIYYGCNSDDAESIGFDDKKFLSVSIPSEEIDRDMCLELFKEYSNKGGEIY